MTFGHATASTSPQRKLYASTQILTRLNRTVHKSLVFAFIYFYITAVAIESNEHSTSDASVDAPSDLGEMQLRILFYLVLKHF